MTEHTQITTPESLSEDVQAEPSLRPNRLAEFIGQPKVRDALSIAIEAARLRKEPLDHVLFHGPPGLGKTTLAALLAREMGVNIKTTSGPVLEKPADLVGILTNQREGDILFIDEIHRLRPIIEEFLYPAMEDWQVDIRLSDGPKAQTMTMKIERFTLVGATTRTGLITGPLRDRFGLVARLDYYEVDDLRSIAIRAAGILDVAIDGDGAHEIARRSRGTPRIANRLLRQVRDYAEVERDGHISAAVAADGLKFFGVDELGLDKASRAVLDSICRRFGGGPVGLSTLAISVSEPTETVEDVYEPYLIQQGLLMRTPRGRVATPAAYAHLGLAVPQATGPVACLLYTSPSPRDKRQSRMPSSA